MGLKHWEPHTQSYDTADSVDAHGDVDVPNLCVPERQASLSITNARSSLKLTSIKSVMMFLGGGRCMGRSCVLARLPELSPATGAQDALPLATRMET